MVMSSPALPIMAGSPLTLTCTVNEVAFLAVNPMIVWTRAGGQNVTGTLDSLTNLTTQLSFDPVTTADADQYTCTATVNVATVDITDRASSNSIDLTVNSKCIYIHVFPHSHSLTHSLTHSPTHSPSPSSQCDRLLFNSCVSWHHPQHLL